MQRSSWQKIQMLQKGHMYLEGTLYGLKLSYKRGQILCLHIYKWEDTYAYLLV